ncbi:MAG: hypothetical protein AB7H90_01365 [Alphaproteobacteria bacterium]
MDDDQSVPGDSDLHRNANGKRIRKSRVRFTPEEIERAIRSQFGNFLGAARALQQATGRPCSRQLITYHVRQRPALQKVVEEVLEEAKDLAEAAVIKAIVAGDGNLAMKYLMTKGKDRGYSTRSEMTGVNGGPIEVTGDARRRIADQLDAMADRVGHLNGRANGAAAAEGEGEDPPQSVH